MVTKERRPTGTLSGRGRSWELWAGIAIALVVLIAGVYALVNQPAAPAATGSKAHKVGPALARTKTRGIRKTVTVPAGLPASALSADEQTAILNAHNTERAQFGQPPLTWNADLASWAQDWANQIAQQNTLSHRPNNPYGENIYAGSPAGTVQAADPVTDWDTEVQFFNTQTNTCPDWQQCGHFTQVVWSTTTQVGCGKASAADGSWEYWVCNYDPPGNLLANPPDPSVKPF